MVSAGQWLRDNSHPDDVIATNQLHATNGAQLRLSFWINAYAERRSMIGSWSYVPRVGTIARDTGLRGTAVPFWDQDLLRQNEQIFSDPTAELLRTMKEEHGVRWLLVNREIGQESPKLRQLAALRLERGPIAIYELS